jgi:phosphoadenosine phosphosulfate reductase
MSAPEVTEAPARARTRSRTDLYAIAEAGQQLFADAGPDDAEAVLAWAAEQFGDSIAVASSFAGGTALLDLAAKAVPGIDVLFLETGYHFPETIGTRDALSVMLDITIVNVKPRLTVPEQDAGYGKDLFARDPNLCCRMRKVEPLAEALGGYDAWITGVRRGDHIGRAGTKFVEWDGKNGMVKINPLAAWSFDQLVDHAAERGLPVNPLLADGYPSIGCLPCTRRVEPGEDPRAGRWAGLAKNECGIHI